MPDLKKEAHLDGKTTALHIKDSNSESILTCGDDGAVTIWDSIDDDEPFQTFKVNNTANCIAIKGDAFYCSNEKGNSLMSYTISDGQTQGLLTRFTAKITAISASKTHVAAGSSDFGIKVINDNGDTCTLSSHEAPILSLSLAPTSNHLLSASCDGTVRLWTIKTKCCLKTLNILPKISDTSLSHSLCGMSWRPDGTGYAVPIDSSVQIYSKDSEEPEATLIATELDQVVNVCEYNSDGSLIAAGGVGGAVVVWGTMSRNLIKSFQLEDKASITSLSWDKADNLLYATDQGYFGSVEVEHGEKSNSKSVKVKDALTSDQIADIFDGGSDLEDDSPAEKAGMDIDEDEIEEAGEDDFKDLIEEVEEEVKSNRKSTKANRIEDDSEDSGDDDGLDLKSEMSGFTGSEAGNKVTDQTSGDKQDLTQSLPTASLSGVTRATEQEAFQPGSTPDNLKSRYLVWNSVGMVKSYSDEDDSTIDIEFHDVSRHHTIHISNTDEYCMADISENCAVLANCGDTTSSLLCYNFSTTDDDNQWKITLDKHELALCVCAANDFVAVATTSHMVRGFTTAGLQLAPFLVPGKPVAMSGYKNVLLVAYHVAPALNDYQHIAISIVSMNTTTREVLTHCSKLPITSKSTLNWIGFTAEGTPTMYTSDGLLSMYRINGQDLWTPILNTKKKDKHSSHFIVSVCESPAQLRSVITKNSKYPPISPRPTISITQFSIPLCEVQSEQGAQQETIWRCRLLSLATNNWLSEQPSDDIQSDYDKQEQTTLLKLFSAACREGRLERAFQTSSLMNDVYLRLAAQYANRTHNTDLALRLQAVSEQRLTSDDTDIGMSSSVFPNTATPMGASGYTYRSYRGDSDLEDDLSRFTSSRFSTTPGREKLTPLHSRKSNRHLKEDASPCKQEQTTTTAHEPTEDSPAQRDRDVTSEGSGITPRPNPFKARSSNTNRQTSIDGLHKLIDQKSNPQPPVQQDKPQQSKAVKQTTLFAGGVTRKSNQSQAKEDSTSRNPEQENLVDSNNENKPVVSASKKSAFDLYFAEKFNGDKLKHSEALEQFKSLPRDTKKAYVAKATAINEQSDKTGDNSDTVNKKRKLDNSEPDPQTVSNQGNKKPLITSSE